MKQKNSNQNILPDNDVVIEEETVIACKLSNEDTCTSIFNLNGKRNISDAKITSKRVKTWAYVGNDSKMNLSNPSESKTHGITSCEKMPFDAVDLQSKQRLNAIWMAPKFNKALTDVDMYFVSDICGNLDTVDDNRKPIIGYNGNNDKKPVIVDNGNNDAIVDTVFSDDNSVDTELQSDIGVIHEVDVDEEYVEGLKRTLSEISLDELLKDAYR